MLEVVDGKSNRSSGQTNIRSYNSGWWFKATSCAHITDTAECCDHALDHWLPCVGSSFCNRAFSSCSLASRGTNHHHLAATATLAMAKCSHSLGQYSG